VKLLGAVLAGGKSSRFGSDKAMALAGGRRLLDRAVEGLREQCDGVVIVGRGEVPDWPEPGRGPLGGLAGALLHAWQHGFDAVLSCAVDSLDLPADLRARLQPAPAFVVSQPVIGLWPARKFEDARAILTSSEKASMHGFAERIGARAVKLKREPANINTPADLARLEQHHGL
jgi:molybdenum cofactor guanylyltransferase